MAGWEEEICGEALLERRCRDRDWLLHRKQEGSYAMLHNRCPHRFATLSQRKRKRKGTASLALITVWNLARAAPVCTIPSSI